MNEKNFYGNKPSPNIKAIDQLSYYDENVISNVS